MTDDRLAARGYSSYAEYLRSAAWGRVRERYVASGRPLDCAVCGEPDAQLHHRTYARVGGLERPADLVPLCGRHHRDLHRLRRTEPWRTTTSAIRALRRRLTVEAGAYGG